MSGRWRAPRVVPNPHLGQRHCTIEAKASRIISSTREEHGRSTAQTNVSINRQAPICGIRGDASGDHAQSRVATRGSRSSYSAQLRC